MEVKYSTEYSTDLKKLKAALLKRAEGYDYEEKIIEAKKDGSQGKVKVIKKHLPPDLKAIELVYELMVYGRW